MLRLALNFMKNYFIWIIWSKFQFVIVHHCLLYKKIYMQKRITILVVNFISFLYKINIDKYSTGSCARRTPISSINNVLELFDVM
jgi:uncharacterized membrane protein